jgi:hypothetical protein
MSAAVKNTIESFITCVNHPSTKTLIKVGANGWICSMAASQLYYIFNYYINNTEEHGIDSSLHKNTAKVVYLCETLSVFLRSAVTIPGVYCIGTLVSCVISDGKLDRIFGKNTIFAVNPWHPRHVCSIAAVILAIPSLAISLKKKISPNSSDLTITQWLTLQGVLLSRPVLHLGNQLCHYVIKAWR